MKVDDACVTDNRCDGSVMLGSMVPKARVVVRTNDEPAFAESSQRRLIIRTSSYLTLPPMTCFSSSSSWSIDTTANSVRPCEAPQQPQMWRPTNDAGAVAGSVRRFWRRSYASDYVGLALLFAAYLGVSYIGTLYVVPLLINATGTILRRAISSHVHP